MKHKVTVSLREVVKRFSYGNFNLNVGDEIIVIDESGKPKNRYIITHINLETVGFETFLESSTDYAARRYTGSIQCTWLDPEGFPTFIGRQVQDKL